MRTKLFALVAVVALFGAALGPGIAAAADEAGNTGTEAGNTGLAVDVTQSEDDVTVSVTENGSGVANATVEVGGENGSTYDGIGEYTTDDDGEVDLPTPAVNETISVTAYADNETATAMADLVAAKYVENETDENASQSDAFGLQVSSFVQSLLGSNESAIGPQVAAFVTQHNPGNAPDHAGPPAHAGPGNDGGDDKRGPPAHAGPGSDDADENETDDDKRGPPANAGPNGADADENETDDDRRGPPADAGPDGDDADENETEDSEETETEDDSGGPPEHANAGGNN